MRQLIIMLSQPDIYKVAMIRLKTTPSTFHDTDFDGSFNCHLLSVDAKFVVSIYCSIIGEQIVII